MKKVLLVLMALALVVFFGTSQVVYAHSNLIPAIKVGGGWVSVVSYINTLPVPAGGQVFIHATYQTKNPLSLSTTCTHLDGRSITTRNDLTTTVLSLTGGGVGTVFPAADTIGGVLIAPPTVAGSPVTEGFLVLENYDSAGVLGADGTLTSEAIIYNLASGFLYSQRALTTTHIAGSPGGNVSIEAPLCGTCNTIDAFPRSAGAVAVLNNTTAGSLTRFAFLPAATATTGAYVVAVNRPGTAELADGASTVNLVAPDYNARIVLQARLDAPSYALGIYNRLEDFRTITQSSEIVCLAQLSIAQLGGAGIDVFTVNGGWVNLSPRCRETEVAGVFQECNFNTIGTEVGDAAIIYKVEFATGYGFAVTPQHQQWYAK